MGQRKQTTGRPRPIFVAFPYIRLKNKMLRNAYKLKEIPNRKYTYLSEDITPEQQSKQRDLRCLNAYPRSMGIDSKLRSDTIIVGGTRYTHAEISKQPHEITLENAKIVEVVTTVPLSVCYGARNLLVRVDASNFVPYACDRAVTGGVRGSRKYRTVVRYLRW